MTELRQRMVNDMILRGMAEKTQKSSFHRGDSWEVPDHISHSGHDARATSGPALSGTPGD